MLIKNPGPRIGRKAIALIEEELEVVLPGSYRQFLLQYNGGTPTPDTIDIPGMAGSPTDVQVFFGIGRSVENSGLVSNFALISERCLALKLLPVACDSGGNLFCLQIERGIATKVVYCDLDGSDCATHDVATSFDEFIAKIRPFEQ